MMPPLRLPLRIKPTGPVARAADYVVRDCPPGIGRAFIARHHYAGGCANTAVFMHGLYRGAELVGVAQWLPPTRRCAESVDVERWRDVLSLSRLAVAPDEPQNAASLLIGRSIRLVAKAGRWAALVTFADESQGHTGTIYRATNWQYVGRTKPQPRWVDADGRQVARLSTKSRTHAEMLALGHRLAGAFAKHKYVYRLDGRKAVAA